VSERVERYAELLLEWNRAVNLTGAKTIEQVRDHIEDALSLLALDWTGVATVIDIGSGGGLPAIPLALQLPQIQFTLLEANARKCAFLLHTAATLTLPNVRVLLGRAEELARQPELRDRFDRAISRAVAPPAVMLELALPFVRPGGDLLAETRHLDPRALEPVARLLGAGPPRQSDGPAGDHAVLRVDKISTTPAAYPRRVGVPNRRPLA
jgi:16S rRNA (guanine527-N7)-methyltransferase